MGLSLKLCTDIINYKCNKPKPSEQWCWRRTGPATPRCPKAHLTLRPLSSTGSHCCLSQKKLSMERYLHIFSSPPPVCHTTASSQQWSYGPAWVPAVKRSTASSHVLQGRASFGYLEMMC